MYAAVKIKKLLPIMTVLVGLILLMVFPAVSAEGIRRGMSYSFEILIPSLFPFMVVSSFIMRTEAAVLLGRVFSPVCRKIFRLPDCCAGGILLSLVGGYPVGAKCVQILYAQHKITAEQAEQMMCFCVCAGPAFLITAVGTIMLNNITTGWILYLSQIISALILGIISRGKKKTDIPVQQENIVNGTGQSVTGAFISAVTDAASSVLSITALVMIFSLIMGLTDVLADLTKITVFLTDIGIPARIQSVIMPVILEVTAGCKTLCESALPLWSFSIALGFGGMCIHCQIFDILKGVRFSRRKYLLYRVINAMLSAFITYCICLVYRPSEDVFALYNGGEAKFTGTGIAGSIAIVILSVLFVLSMRRKNYSGHQSFFPNI